MDIEWISQQIRRGNYEFSGHVDDERQAERIPIADVGRGKITITADTALRLGRYFSMSPQFWLGLQMDYGLDVTADNLEKRLKKEVKPHAAAF